MAQGTDRPARISLGEALFSGTRRKVLGLLFGQPERTFSISELIRLAGAGSGGVQREVERLSESGLVRVRFEGRQKWYQANPDAPVFEELCALVRKTLGPAARLRAALQPLGAQLDLAVLYGSLAKGTDHAASDIDLLLVSDTLTLEEAFRALEPVEKELGRPVNPTLYTCKEYSDRLRRGSPFLKNVVEGRHIVLKGELHGETSAG